MSAPICTHCGEVLSTVSHPPSGQERDCPKRTSKNVVRVGSIIESEFGVGPVVAITKEWIVHEDDGGCESAIHRQDMYWSLLPDEVVEGGGDDEVIHLDVVENRDG